MQIAKSSWRLFIFHFALCLFTFDFPIRAPSARIGVNGLMSGASPADIIVARNCEVGSIFFAPLSGLSAAYRRVDVLANNIANLNTVGFHASRATSMDLSPLGTALQSIQRSGQTGFFFPTGTPTDMALPGDAFFEVKLEDGSTAYTRGGTFTPDREGYLTTPGGQRLQPPVSVPAGAQGVFVGTDGRVTAVVDGETRDIGRVQVVRFNNPTGLRSIGDDLLQATGSSGQPSHGYPGEGSFPPLYAGYLEGSNVDVAQEMVGLSLEKMAVAADVKALKAAEEIVDESLKIAE